MAVLGAPFQPVIAPSHAKKISAAAASTTSTTGARRTALGSGGTPRVEASLRPGATRLPLFARRPAPIVAGAELAVLERALGLFQIALRLRRVDRLHAELALGVGLARVGRLLRQHHHAILARHLGEPGADG